MKRTAILFGALCAALIHAQPMGSASDAKKPEPAPAAFYNVETVLAALSPRCVGPTTMGGRVTDIAVFEKEPRIFYVASAAGGLWKTENAGLTFTATFDNQSTVALGAVAVSQKDPNLVWVGTGEGTGRNSVSWGDGVYKSTDGGKTWTHMGLRETMHISRVIIDPQDEDTVYVAALGRLWGYNKERGLYKTTDGGKTWKQVLYIDEKTGVGDLEIDPKNPKVLYAATYERLRKAYDFLNGGPGSALWKTTDGGKTWRKIMKGMPPGPFGRFGIGINPLDPKMLVATVEYRAPRPPETPKPEEKKPEPAKAEEKKPEPAKAEEKKPEPAKAEEKKPEQARTETKREEPRAQAGGRFETGEVKKDKPGQGVYVSKDGGESWTYMNALNPRPFYFSIPAIDPSDPKRIYVPGVNLHYSDDGGKSFKVMSSSVHVDHHAIWINPKDSNHIILGQDGGAAQSRDRGKTWEMLKGLPIGQYYAVTYDMRRPYWVYGGLQDNGSWATPTQTRRVGPAYYDTYLLSYGDGFYVQVDPTDWRTVYSESQGGEVVRTDQVTGQQKSIKPTLRGERLRFNWNTPILLSPHNPQTLYVGANRLMKSVNRGDSWVAVSPDLTTNDPAKQQVGKAAVAPDIDSGAERHCTITTVSESPLKAGLLWVGTDDGNLWVSEDGGAKWENVLKNVPDVPKNTWVSRVHASKYAEGRCYVTFDGHRSDDFKPYVFVTEDMGKTWTSLANGLPEGDTVHVIREGLQNADLLFLGSEMGLRVSLDRGKSWTRVKNGFPTTPVYDLAIHPREQDLIIGTHGRSIWTMDISSLEALTKDAAGNDVVVTKPQDVLLLGRVDGTMFQGDATWISRNTQPGTRIYYHLKADAKEDVKVIITDVIGRNSVELTGGKKAGLNSVAWNGRIRGRIAEPGDYRVVVRVDGKEYTTAVKVLDLAAQW